MRPHDHPQVRPGDRRHGARRRAPPGDLAARRRAPRARRLDARARPDRRRAHRLEGRHPHVEGLQGVPRRALHLAQFDGRARHPGRLPGEGGRPHLGRPRRHARRARRRQRRHAAGGRDLAGGAAAPRRLPGGPRGRHRGGPGGEPALGHLARRPDRRRGGRLLRRAEPRRPRRRALVPRGPADPELRAARQGPAPRRGDDPRDRADDHGRPSRGLRPRRRLVDLLGRRVPRRALRAHRRDHRGRPENPHESRSRSATMIARRERLCRARESRCKGPKAMKVRPSVKPMCERCRIIKRHGTTMVICSNPRHKQRQG